MADPARRPREWLKKVNKDLRKGERAKPDIAGRDKSTARE